MGAKVGVILAPECDADDVGARRYAKRPTARGRNTVASRSYAREADVKHVAGAAVDTITICPLVFWQRRRNTLVLAAAHAREHARGFERVSKRSLSTMARNWRKSSRVPQPVTKASRSFDSGPTNRSPLLG